MAKDLPILLFATPAELEAWLEESHTRPDGFWLKVANGNRYAIVYRLNDAKKPETRERRLRKFVAMLERGEKIH
jgi:uncharacterized protein YdeI (YjbR/CyaY-like superfamily)